ncbi:MAG TPA: type II toxin-antitoxin system VapC family toxin [Candidatus Acidoferrales bacterium]|nr:type II toxin-antitoxin system VapC family toxin [Candidatus Acidoferrales bacterium]
MTTRSGSELYLVDSSGWLEYLTEDSKASAFGHYLEGEASVLVPSVVIYEVYKHLAKHRGRTLADRFASQALVRRVVPLDETIALAAANASLDHRLAPTDAIIYATARVCQAQLVTANTHFRGLPGVIIP